MYRSATSVTLMDGYAPRTITSSTDATPIVVTTGTHGYVTGDKITITGHATNTNANGVWTITVTSTTKFSLDGSTATGGGAGGNTGCHCKTVGMTNVSGHQHCTLSFDTDGGGDAAFTVKLVGSIQETQPDFAAPKSPTNSYEFIYMNDLEDSANNIAGDDGFVVATVDDNRLFEGNFTGIEWLGVLPTAGTAGELTVNLRKFSNQ